MLCYLKFYFEQRLYGEEHQYRRPFPFFLKNTKLIKQKKIINISYLIMVLIKMRFLIFLVLSRYWLACKYRIISQIPIYNWMENCIFCYFWYCIFIFLRSDYNSLLPQVRWFVTSWNQSSIISSDSNLTQNTIRETIKEAKKRWNKIEYNIEYDLYF